MTTQGLDKNENFKLIPLLARVFSNIMVTFLFLYLINNYLVFWQGWPGVSLFFSHQGWIIFEVLDPPLPENLVTLGWIQLIAYLAILISVLTYVLKTEHRTLREDSMRFTSLAAYVVQVAFWMVFLIGMVDTVISFLRVEGFLANLVSQDLLQALGRPNFRGTYVHYPLMGLSLVVAWFIRSLSFIWLAYMVVMAEFLIVISRFVFSYEQAFMGDIVRFWYAALFLFASSYTLLKEGHVRVDVLYAHFPKRKKAISNIAGSLFLGIPLCWVILTQGMAGKASSLNAPLINFEISQSGYGLYTKYLMAGFMIIFAVSMMIQFVSDLLGKVADLEGEAELSEEMN